MDFNKRRENAFDRLLANKPELDRSSSHIFESSNQLRETRISDLGSKPREEWKEPDRLPAEGRRGSSEKNKQAAELSFFCFQLGPRCRHATCLAFGA
jgi:hypothetical protein